MISNFRFGYIRLIIMVFAVQIAHADPATLVKARAFVGSDAALDSVQSLRMTGKLEVMEKGQPVSDAATLEIIFQKPDRQRICATGTERTEITALDGYDAWSRVSEVKDSSSWRVTLLAPDQIKRLRANTFENLAFYRGLEKRGIQVVDKGVSEVDGISCRKIAFIHAPDIVFTRSFDVATGRLVLTETDNGTQIREEGEIRSGGIRFPARIITVNTFPDGTKRTIRVDFSEVSVNPVIDESLFAVPSLSE